MTNDNVVYNLNDGEVVFVRSSGEFFDQKTGKKIKYDPHILLKCRNRKLTVSTKFLISLFNKINKNPKMVEWISAFRDYEQETDKNKYRDEDENEFLRRHLNL